MGGGDGAGTTTVSVCTAMLGACVTLRPENEEATSADETAALTAD